MGTTIVIGGDVQPRLGWVDEAAHLEFQPHVAHIVRSVEQAEAMRDAYQAIVDGFAARAIRWAAEQELLDEFPEAV